MLQARVLTALVLLAVMAGLLFSGSALLWQAGIFAVALAASWEWGGLSKFPPGLRVLYTGASAVLMGMLAWRLRQGNEKALLEGMYGASLVFWMVCAPLWLARNWKVESRGGLALTGWLVIVPTGFSLVTLQAIGPWVMLMFMAVVWVSDSAAYFTGRAFGRHKLAPAISPGKTWEGVAGGVAAVALYAAVLASGWPGRIPGPAGYPLLLGLTALGIEGDLFESWIKRCAGVKDSGTLLPGHGGILDRIDALTPTLPLAALWMLEKTV